MPFQSVIKKKGWRPQALSFLASSQVLCKNCLSRQYVSASVQTHRLIDDQQLRKSTKNILSSWSPVQTLSQQLIPSQSVRPRLKLPRHFSSLTNTAQEPPYHDTDLVTQFRLALYPPLETQPQNKNKNNKNRKSSAIKQKTIIRRQRRKHLFERYTDLKKRRLLNHLSYEDFRTLVAILIPNPDNQQAKPIVLQTISVLEDLKQLSADHSHLQFSLTDVETLVSLYRETGATNDAALLLHNLHRLGTTPTERSYSDMIAMLAKAGDVESALGWLKTIKASGVWPPSNSIKGSIVQAWLELGNDTAAIDFLREHPGDAIISTSDTKPNSNPNHNNKININDINDDDKDALLDMALDVFFNESLKRWRLNDCRAIYRLKQKRGYSTSSLLSRLTYKTIHTFQTHTSLNLLQDTLDLKDTAGCGIVAGQMIKYCISTKNLAMAVNICKHADHSQNSISVDHYTHLITKLAHARYSVDLMTIYRQFTQKYPQSLSISLYTTIIQGLTAAKQYHSALQVLGDLRQTIPDHQLDENSFLPLYKLCAQAGYLDLFKQTFALNKSLGRPLTHKAFTSLMACYVTAKDPESAKAVFQAIMAETKGPDTVDFNLLIRATALEKTDGDSLEKIFEIIRHMKTADINPDQTTLRTLLDIYKTGDLADMLLQKLINDPHATHSDNIWLNNLSMTRLLKNTPPSTVASIFLSNKRDKLLKSSTKGVPIASDGMSYQILIDALTKSPTNVHIAESLYQHMHSRGHKASQSLHHQMILAWARKGRMAKARRMVVRMEEEIGEKAGIEAFSIIISGYLGHNQRENAQRIIDEDLAQRGLVPDQRLLNILSEYDKNGNIYSSSPTTAITTTTTTTTTTATATATDTDTATATDTTTDNPDNHGL
ncbi:hypothetical protein PHYBLDRAFT_60283 [Phycomyces blakesleeanus NRRL 1555(-)]|uniref:Pentacotripeptide-repeat region of PRORP domain-containing protein n=2 Tax=Phycomyces blakesleeanus TaxID=4837 RepID=A0A162NK12_PHYB8|nr:hypothetical protein PHYBLDRAFT_60283 [Phycomyces blakesleeanus NRRL 1555(-)]OAD70384.1 hypothetical protein PHYBLDRAFT_60283 [Phycomyces blakesleeanus NRRL 1555(-)]|eukprot:XP_018288424.1 hypothetical protein PHYBLDRAFT_60283 [Phycomyces blakesleeanus NRRL 1555(-)]